MPPPAKFRPVTWPDQMLVIMRAITPDQIDAMSKAAPDLRGPLLEMWQLARCPTRDEYDAQARATDGKELLTRAWDWLTTPEEKKLRGTGRGTIGVRVGVHTRFSL